MICLIIPLNKLNKLSSCLTIFLIYYEKNRWMVYTTMMGRVLVFNQFSIIFIMLLPFNKEIENFYIGLIVIVIGLIIGILALKINKLDNFNITPYLKDDCKLITDGIYKYIRHPMYSSVIVSMAGVLILYYNTTDLVLYIILVINMLVKMYYEEYLWKNRTSKYRSYCKNTKKLIPFIF